MLLAWVVAVPWLPHLDARVARRAGRVRVSWSSSYTDNRGHRRVDTGGFSSAYEMPFSPDVVVISHSADRPGFPSGTGPPCPLVGLPHRVLVRQHRDRRDLGWGGSCSSGRVVGDGCVAGRYGRGDIGTNSYVGRSFHKSASVQITLPRSVPVQSTPATIASRRSVMRISAPHSLALRRHAR